MIFLKKFLIIGIALAGISQKASAMENLQIKIQEILKQEPNQSIICIRVNREQISKLVNLVSSNVNDEKLIDNLYAGLICFGEGLVINCLAFGPRKTISSLINPYKQLIKCCTQEQYNIDLSPCEFCLTGCSGCLSETPLCCCIPIGILTSSAINCWLEGIQLHFDAQ